MDTIIDAALKQLETEALEGMPHVETSWDKFEKALKEKQPKKSKRYYAKIALIASFALVLLLSTQIERVTAFKNEVFQWIGKDYQQGTVISEIENPTIEPGTYKGLSFDEVQGRTLFHILKPEFLPAGINKTPEIELEVYEYPLLSVKMQFQGDQQKILIFFQEKTSGNMETNTYVPKNAECKELSIGDKNVVFISIANTVKVQWTENGIRYYFTTFGIKEEDVLRIIKSLK